MLRVYFPCCSVCSMFPLSPPRFFSSKTASSSGGRDKTRNDVYHLFGLLLFAHWLSKCTTDGHNVCGMLSSSANPSVRKWYFWLNMHCRIDAPDTDTADYNQNSGESERDRRRAIHHFKIKQCWNWLVGINAHSFNDFGVKMGRNGATRIRVAKTNKIESR